jgi:hypothetical protein
LETKERKKMKTIKLIQNLVEQELKEFTGPDGAAPYRQPAADTANEPREPTEVDDLYKLALKARLATESLVAALDHPIYDQAFEAAFKATAALRDALNALENVGAEPKPEDRVVSPPKEEQPLGSGFGVKHMPMTHTGDNI